ncbi:MAG: PDZ domain-containing protein [Planctomycetes bacterium]|nr:PDZ domain-containing protein [Planctomycetota bacterium]
MQFTTTRLVLSAVLSLAVFAARSPTQTELERQVAGLVARADAAGLDAAWATALDISELEASEDALVRAIAQAAERSGPVGRVTAAAAVRAVADGEAFGKEILAIVRPVLDAKDPAVQVAALSILGDEQLFNQRLEPEIRELFRARVEDELADPLTRVEAAHGLFGIGTEVERLTSKRTLTDFLRSRDDRLRVQAALALADLGTDSTSPSWAVLREVATRPNADGRLARSYLALERERRMFQSRLLELTRDGEPQAGPSDDRFAKLRELMLTALAQHVRGASFDEKDMIEAAAKGLMESLDQHSAYFTSDEFQRFFFDLNREYGGIGAYVNFDRDNVFSIVRPIYSGPAYGAGLRSGDKILEVDGWETAGHTSEEIIARLKGEPNTSVVLKIMRPGLQEAQDVSITRAEIQVPSVSYEMLPGGVGYAEILTYAQGTAAELRQAVREMQARGMKALVLDVRNNTGGYLLAARDVVELFVKPRELVVFTQGRDPRDRQEYRTRPGRQIATDLPLAVLVNEYTASAAEITAGALQDLGRAVIIGDRTFGKGSVQQLLPLRSEPPEEYRDENDNGIHDDWEPYEDRNGNGKYDVGPRMKLTVARYHLPSGRCIHKDIDKDGKILNPDWGVQPDIAIELREVSLKDAWKNAEIFDLFQKGAFRTYAENLVKSQPELALQLADSDGGSTARYPDFDAYYQGLDTKLSPDDVRRWVRYLLRDLVADLRGKAYPGGRAVGDYQEDQQLQRAILDLLKKAGGDARQVPEYAPVLKVDESTTAAKDE